MAVNKLLSPALILPALCLCACAVDLGVFEKSDGYASYYDSFGDVKCLYDGGDVSYDIKDSLFNNDTINSMSWKDEDDAVEDKQYLYIIIPIETELKIESIALYFRSAVTITTEISAFYFVNEDAAPKKIKYLTSPDTEPIYDSDDNIIGEEEIEYDDPLVENSLVHGNVSLVKEEWTSFVLGNFQQDGYDDGYLHAFDEGLFYLRVENNSGLNVGRLEPVSFSFINLIIRAV